MQYLKNAWNKKVLKVKFFNVKKSQKVKKGKKVYILEYILEVYYTE